MGTARAGARPGQPVGLWHRGLAATLRGVYSGRVRVHGAPASGSDHPRVILASHRNGAIDGTQVRAAYPRAQFLVSIQLLRHAAARLLFTGIPVVRGKDVERYGLNREEVSDPIDAACNHLRAGGELAIFPEGTSEWGFQPLPYRPGAARIVCRLMEEGLEPEVIPMGLFYSRPDRFRSRAELFRGTPVQLPPRGAGDRAEWEAAVNQALAGALDEVSVNCLDQATFDLVQGRAAARARQGESFSEAFLELQAAVAAGGPVPDTSSPARVGPASSGWP